MPFSKEIYGHNRSKSKCFRVDVSDFDPIFVTFRVFFNNLRYIQQIPLKCTSSVHCSVQSTSIVSMHVFDADHHIHGHHEAKNRSIILRFRGHNFVSGLTLNNASLEGFNVSYRYHKSYFVMKGRKMLVTNVWRYALNER